MLLFRFWDLSRISLKQGLFSLHRRTFRLLPRPSFSEIQRPFVCRFVTGRSQRAQAICPDARSLEAFLRWRRSHPLCDGRVDATEISSVRRRILGRHTVPMRTIRPNLSGYRTHMVPDQPDSLPVTETVARIFCRQLHSSIRRC